MLVSIERHMVENTVVPMIDNCTARRIDAACFRDGNEGEFRVEFFSLWGEVIRSCYNGRTTRYDYQWVKGEDKGRVLAYLGEQTSHYQI